MTTFDSKASPADNIIPPDVILIKVIGVYVMNPAQFTNTWWDIRISVVTMKIVHECKILSF